LFGAFFTRRTQNWRDASREPLLQFGRAGAQGQGNWVCILEKGKLKADVVESFQYLKRKVLRNKSQSLFRDTQCEDEIQLSQVAPPREIPTTYKEQILHK